MTSAHACPVHWICDHLKSCEDWNSIQLHSENTTTHNLIKYSKPTHPQSIQSEVQKEHFPSNLISYPVLCLSLILIFIHVNRSILMSTTLLEPKSCSIVVISQHTTVQGWIPANHLKVHGREKDLTYYSLNWSKSPDLLQYLHHKYTLPSPQGTLNAAQTPEAKKTANTNTLHNSNSPKHSPPLDNPQSP